MLLDFFLYGVSIVYQDGVILILILYSIHLIFIFLKVIITIKYRFTVMHERLELCFELGYCYSLASFAPREDR